MRLSILLLLPLLSAAAHAQTPCHAEFGSSNYQTGSTMGGPLVAIKITVPAPVTVTRMEMHTGNKTGTSTVYLYAHDPVGNQPIGLDPLATGTFSEVTTIGWQGADVAPPVVLPANTTIWFGWKPVGGELVPREGSGATLPGVQQYRGTNDNGKTWTGPFTAYQWKLRLFCNGKGNGAVLTFGAGCNGSNQQAQTIGSSGIPMVGKTYSITLAKAAGVRPASLGLGFSNTSWGPVPLPFDMAVLNAPGCKIYSEFALSFANVSDPSGNSTQIVAVPNDPALFGLHVFHQWAIIDVLANGLGVCTSGGARAGIGL